MSAAPALQEVAKTSETSQNEALHESSEFLIEKAFAEKGIEGLEAMAEEDVASSVERLESLTDIPAETPEAADEIVTQLKSAKAQAEQDLLAAKKKLFLALGKGMDHEQAKAELEPMKAAVVEATEALKSAEEEQAPQTEPIEKASVDTVDASQDGAKLVSEQMEEVRIAPEMVEDGSTATEAMETEIQEESPKEMSEVTSLEVASEKGETESDWDALTVAEQLKKESAESDYIEAQKILADFQQERTGTLTPIEQKYITVLQTQLEMDRLTAALAGSQMALYALNKTIDTLTAANPENPELATLTEEQTEKTNFSQNLTIQLEEAAKEHNEVREEYDTSLEAFAEPASEEGDAEESTRGSFSGSSSERPLALTPEDEASFEARAAGVEIDKSSKKETDKTKPETNKAKGRAKGLWSFMKRKESGIVNPTMKLSGGGGEVKKKRGFFKWLFDTKW